LFLSGGASVMPYTAQFFAEKLNVPVEYFNPFRNVQIDPSVNLEELARVAHSLGEVVGLGLRNLAHCPVELNLIPESTRRMQSFNEKKPYLVATVFSLVGVVGAMGLLFHNLAKVKEDWLNEKVLPNLVPLQEREQKFKKAYQELITTTNELNQVTTWMGDRYYWGDVLTELRQVLIRTEQKSKEQLNSTDTGIWIEQFLTTSSSGVAPDISNPTTGTATPAYSTSTTVSPAEAERMRMMYMRGAATPDSAPTTPTPVATPTPTPGTPALELASAGTNQISLIKLLCRGVDLSAVDAAANTKIIYTLENELKASTNWFEPKDTQLVGQIMVDDTTHTFTIGVLVALKRPLKL
jgi:hypothetical protein